MKKIEYTYLVLLSLVTILMSSCEKVIDFDIPEADPKLVINGYLSTTDSLKVHVGSSLSYLDGGEPAFLSNADVSIYKNGNLLGELTPGYEDLGEYKFSELLDGPGEYRVVASAPGFDEVSVVTEIPDPLNDVEVQFLEELENNEYRFRLNFSDTPGQDDYYHMVVVQRYESFGLDYSVLSFSSNSEVFLDEEDNFSFDGENQFWDRAVFSDGIFNGQSTTVDFKVNLPGLNDSGVEYFVQFLKCSEDYYLYHKSIYAEQYSGDGPFTQPVQIYTNVEDGLGCVAGYYMQLLPLEN